MEIRASVKKITPHLYDKRILTDIPEKDIQKGEYLPTPKEIRVSIYRAEALHLTPWQHCSWLHIVSILNIDGVVYYTVDNTIGVAYDEGADPVQIAATSAVIVAKLLNTPISEVKVTVDDGGSYIRQLDPEMAEEIWTRAQTVEVPPEPSQRDIISIGKSPAYWLRDVFCNQSRKREQ